MKRNKRNDAIALALALLLAAAPAVAIPTAPQVSVGAAEPEGWHRFFLYLGCATAVYVAADTGGAAIMGAVAMCGMAYNDHNP